MRQTEKLLQGLKWRCIRGELPREVTQVAYDSRKVEPGALFVCIQGSRQDGHAFIREAVERGAAAILTEKDVIDEEQINQMIDSLRQDAQCDKKVDRSSEQDLNRNVEQKVEYSTKVVVYKKMIY